MARSARQIASQLKAAKVSATKRKTNARKLDALDALTAKLPDGAYGVTSKGGFITRESYGEQAWTSLGQYTRAKTPKPKKIANGLGPSRGWGGSGNGDGGY